MFCAGLRPPRCACRCAGCWRRGNGSFDAMADAGSAHGQAHQRDRRRRRRAAPGRRSPLVPGRSGDGVRAAEDRLHVRAVRQGTDPERAVVPPVVEGRRRARARGRDDRSDRRAVPDDRVLARRDQRPDRLRAHAGGDRERGVHRRRPGSHEQHAGRRPDGLHQRAGTAARIAAAVHLQRRTARSSSPTRAGQRRRLLEDQRPAEHDRSRRGHIEGARRAPRLVRRSRRCGPCRRHGALARVGHGARRRGRQHHLGLRAGAARAGDHGDGDRRSEHHRSASISPTSPFRRCWSTAPRTPIRRTARPSAGTPSRRSP